VKLFTEQGLNQAWLPQISSKNCANFRSMVGNDFKQMSAQQVLTASAQMHLRVRFIAAVASLIVFLGVGSPLSAQKTSIWTGDATANDWSDADNWDTSEDPNGGDTAIVDFPDSITLDANRTLGKFELYGETGRPISISGSSQLTVSNSLTWNHTRLVGSGSFTSSNRSTIEGLADLGGWTALLGGTNTFNADFRSNGSVTISGITDLGTSSFTGNGPYIFNGDLTKNTADASHTTVINPRNLTISGAVTATRGVIVIKPEKVDSLAGASCMTAADGRLRLTSDNVTYDGITFTNEGQMDITDEILATESSINLAGNLISDGSQPVVLGGGGE